MVRSMQVLGCKVSDDDTVAEEIDHRIGKGVRAFHTHKKQLLCKKVGIQARLTLLYKLVGQSMLFGMETIPLSDYVLSRMSGAYSKMVVQMLGDNCREDEDIPDFLERTRSYAKS
eukprot:12418826-Karenia_brevis.AAC.1